MPSRSEREGKYLWSMLKEIDKEMARESKRMQAKKCREVSKARKRMGVAKSSPA